MLALQGSNIQNMDVAELCSMETNMITLESDTFMDSLEKLEVLFRNTPLNRSLVKQRRYSEGQNVRLCFAGSKTVDKIADGVESIYGILTKVDFDSDSVIIQLDKSAGKYENREIRIDFSFKGFPMNSLITNLIPEKPNRNEYSSGTTEDEKSSDNVCPTNVIKEENETDARQASLDEFAMIFSKEELVADMVRKIYLSGGDGLVDPVRIQEMDERIEKNIYGRTKKPVKRGVHLLSLNEIEKDVESITMLMDDNRMWRISDEFMNRSDFVPGTHPSNFILNKWIIPIGTGTFVTRKTNDDILLLAEPGSDICFTEFADLLSNFFQPYAEKKSALDLYETRSVMGDLEILIGETIDRRNTSMTMEPIRSNGFIVLPQEYISFAKYYSQESLLLDKVRHDKNYLSRWLALSYKDVGVPITSSLNSWGGWYDSGCTEIRLPLKKQNGSGNPLKESAWRDIVAPSTKQLLKKISRDIQRWRNSKIHPKKCLQNIRKIIGEGSINGIQNAISAYATTGGICGDLRDSHVQILRSILEDYDVVQAKCYSLERRPSSFPKVKKNATIKSSKNSTKATQKEARLLLDLFLNEERLSELRGITSFDELVYKNNDNKVDKCAQLLKRSKKIDNGELFYHLIVQKAFQHDKLRSTHDVLLAYSTEDFLNQDRCFYAKLVKKYENMDCLLSEHRIAIQAGIPLFVDIGYDTTPYRLLDIIKMRLQKKKVEESRELLIQTLSLQLMEDYGYDDRKSSLVAGFILDNKRPVMENEYAVVQGQIQDDGSKSPRRFFRWEWIQSQKGQWILDLDVDEFSFISICNASLAASSKLEIGTLRQSMREIFLKRMLSAFDKQNERTSSSFARCLGPVPGTQVNLSQIDVNKEHSRLLCRYNARMSRYNGRETFVGKEFSCKFSPYLKKRDEILKQFSCCGDKSVCFYDNIYRFVGECCRMCLSEEEEETSWLYCRLTSIPILPVIYLRAAECFRRGEYISRILENEPLLGLKLFFCDNCQRVTEANDTPKIRMCHRTEREPFQCGFMSPALKRCVVYWQKMCLMLNLPEENLSKIFWENISGVLFYGMCPRNGIQSVDLDKENYEKEITLTAALLLISIQLSDLHLGEHFNGNPFRNKIYIKNENCKKELNKDKLMVSPIIIFFSRFLMDRFPFEDNHMLPVSLTARKFTKEKLFQSRKNDLSEMVLIFTKNLPGLRNICTRFGRDGGAFRENDVPDPRVLSSMDGTQQSGKAHPISPINIHNRVIGFQLNALMLYNVEVLVMGPLIEDPASPTVSSLTEICDSLDTLKLLERTVTLETMGELNPRFAAFPIRPIHLLEQMTANEKEEIIQDIVIKLVKIDSTEPILIDALNQIPNIAEFKKALREIDPQFLTEKHTKEIFRLSGIKSNEETFNIICEAKCKMGLNNRKKGSISVRNPSVGLKLVKQNPLQELDELRSMEKGNLEKYNTWVETLLLFGVASVTEEEFQTKLFETRFFLSQRIFCFACGTKHITSTEKFFVQTEILEGKLFVWSNPNAARFSWSFYATVIKEICYALPALIKDKKKNENNPTNLNKKNDSLAYAIMDNLHIDFTKITFSKSFHFISKQIVDACNTLAGSTVNTNKLNISSLLLFSAIDLFTSLSNVSDNSENPSHSISMNPLTEIYDEKFEAPLIGKRQIGIDRDPNKILLMKIIREISVKKQQHDISF